MQASTQRVGLAAMAALLGLACEAALAASADLVRVKAAVPEIEQFAPDLALTGAIAARIQTNVAFRASGKVTSRRVEVGQHVSADDILATLDPREQQADVENAQAALASAQAQAQQAELTFGRQKSLLESGFATRANFDQAQEALNTSRAQVRAAEAALATAREQLSYANLRAGRNGIIVSRSVEAGQVVQAGQVVFVLAEDGPRDAVFAVPEALLTAPPADKTVDVALQSDPSVRTTGTVREISPILDPATSTVTVKIGLAATPPGMTLGAAVVGRAHWQQQRVIKLPWSALVETDGQPAVWVLDDANRVSLRPVEVQSYVTGAVLLKDGVGDHQRVVTAGGQLLFPGQTVAVAEGSTP